MLVVETVMVSMVRVLTSLKTEMERVKAVMAMACSFLLTFLCIFAGAFKSLYKKNSLFKYEISKLSLAPSSIPVVCFCTYIFFASVVSMFLFLSFLLLFPSS